MSGLREPVTHSLGGRALLFLGLFWVVMTLVIVLANPLAIAAPWVGVMVGGVFLERTWDETWDGLFPASSPVVVRVLDACI